MRSRIYFATNNSMTHKQRLFSLAVMLILLTITACSAEMQTTASQALSPDQTARPTQRHYQPEVLLPKTPPTPLPVPTEVLAPTAAPALTTLPVVLMTVVSPSPSPKPDSPHPIPNTPLAQSTSEAIEIDEIPALPEVPDSDFDKRLSSVITATLQEPTVKGEQYRIDIIVGRSSSSCTRIGGYDMESPRPYEIRVTVYHYSLRGENLMCTRDYLTDQFIIDLGAAFEPTETYTVNINGKKKITFKGVM